MGTKKKRDASVKELTSGAIGLVYTSEEAAAQLRVGQRTVLRAIKAKKLRATKIGKAWKITEADLQAYFHGQPSNVE